METLTPAHAKSGRSWAYTGAILGGLVSIAANVAHSFIAPHDASADWQPEPGAVVGAVVWPVFLFVAVEILARVRWPHGWGWQLTRWGGLLPVTTVAAIVSYRHLSGLLEHYGEEPLVYLLGPLAVDGLMVMATAALMATGRHRTTIPDPTTVPIPTAVPAQIPVFTPMPAPTIPASSTSVPAMPPPVAEPTAPIRPSAQPVAASPAPKPAEVTQVVPVPTPAALADRIGPKPQPQTANPQPAATPVARTARPHTSTPTGPATPLTPSSTDIHVAAKDAVQLVLPLANPEVLARARQAARDFLAEDGTRINASQLARRLKISSDEAAQLLKSINDTTLATSTVNGRPVNAQ